MITIGAAKALQCFSQTPPSPKSSLSFLERQGPPQQPTQIRDTSSGDTYRGVRRKTACYQGIRSFTIPYFVRDKTLFWSGQLDTGRGSATYFASSVPCRRPISTYLKYICRRDTCVLLNTSISSTPNSKNGINREKHENKDHSQKRNRPLRGA